MVKTVYDVVQPQLLGTIIERNPEAQEPYLGDALFPAQKMYDLELRFLKGADRAPLALKAAALDAKAPIRQRPEADEVVNEIPFFREAYSMKEKTFRELHTLLGNPNVPEAWKQVARAIYDDVTDLYKGARARVEMMRMQLLSSGRIGFKSNRIEQDIDYQFKDENIIDLDLTSPDAPLLDQLDELFETTFAGKGISRAIVNSATLRGLKNNKQLAGAIAPQGSTNRVNTSTIVDYLQEEYGIQIVTYDKTYNTTDTEDGSIETHPFFPKGVITFLPANTLGVTAYAATPEELVQGESAYGADVSVVNNVAITTEFENHPVRRNIWASMYALPTFEGGNNVFIVNVDGEDTP